MSKIDNGKAASPAVLKPGDHFRCDLIYLEFEVESAKEPMIQNPGRFSRSFSNKIYGRVPRAVRLNPNLKTT